MRYLLVIDMQEDYVGKKRNVSRYPYNTKELIDNVNKRIDEYNQESVVYIINKFFFEMDNVPKKLVDELHVVSNNIFQKKKKSVFSIQKLQDLLKVKCIDSVELVGVDGNYCVGASALDGVRKGFTILCNEACIGVGNTKKFKEVKNKLTKEGIQFI